MTVIVLSKKIRQRARKLARDWGYFDGRDAADAWVSSAFRGLTDDDGGCELAQRVLDSFDREDDLFNALPEPQGVDHTIELLFEEVSLPKRERKALKKVLGDIYFKSFIETCDGSIKRQCRFVIA